MNSNKRNYSNTSDNSYPNKSQNTNDEVIFRGGDTLAWLTALPEIDWINSNFWRMFGVHRRHSTNLILRTKMYNVHVRTSLELQLRIKQIYNEWKGQTKLIFEEMTRSFPWLPFFIRNLQIPQWLNAVDATNFILQPTDGDIERAKGYLDSFVDSLNNGSYPHWLTTETTSIIQSN
jgi:hypothetical protein